MIVYKDKYSDLALRKRLIMKKIKLIYVVLLIVAMTLVTSCKREKDSTTTNIEIWHYYSNATEIAFDSMVEDFNNTYGKENKINVTALSLNYIDNLASSLLASANGEVGSSQMPDMFLSYADTAYELDMMGKVASLEGYFTEDDLSVYNEGFISECRLGENNELKILPVVKATEAFYLNKTDFDKFLASSPNSGLGYESLETVEGIIEVAEAYYNATGKAFYGRDSLSNYFVVGAKQLGIDLFDYDASGNFFVNFDEAVFKKLWECYYVPYVKGYFTAQSKFRSTDAKKGNLLSYTGSTSSAGYFPGAVKVTDDYEYDIESYVAFAPKFTASTQNYAVSQGAGFAITKSTKGKEEACVKFLKWLSTEDHIQTFSDLTSYIPASSDFFTEKYINSKKGIQKETFKICKSTIETSYMYTNTPSISGSSIRSILDTSLNTYAQNALKQVNSLVEAGVNRDEAISRFISNDNFNNWFNSIKVEINNKIA